MNSGSGDEAEKTMTAHYEEIMELWEEGKFSDAIRYFSQWMSEGLAKRRLRVSGKKGK